MSIESVKKFFDSFKADEKLYNQVEECKDDEAIIDLAKEKGFDFTKEELEESKSELSDDDLENVAGGMTKDRRQHPGGLI